MKVHLEQNKKWHAGLRQPNSDRLSHVYVSFIVMPDLSSKPVTKNAFNERIKTCCHNLTVQ